MVLNNVLISFHGSGDTCSIIGFASSTKICRRCKVGSKKSISLNAIEDYEYY